MHRRLVCLVMLLAGASLSTSFNTEPGRLGCYQDNGARVWKQWRNTHQKNNVHFCRNMCQDFQFAGMQAGQWCMCGDEVPPKSLPDARCKTACPGDPGQTCGGTWALEVFPVEPKPVMLGRPMGCFKDAANRVWKTGLIKLQSNSQQRCFNSCRGFKYAGLEYGHWCVCGDHLPHTPLPASKCQTPCIGYPGKTCGGPWALEVFELGEAVETTPTAMPGGTAQADTDYALDTPRGDLGLYKLFAGRRTWDEAWQQCEDDEAHLLIINSEDEAAFVRRLFAQAPGETRMHAGFHDLLRKGTYRTLFGEPLSGYTTWSPLFPSVTSAIQHCGSVDQLARLEQVDGNCGTRAAFVCEKKSHSPDSNGGAFQMDPRGALLASNQG